MYPDYFKEYHFETVNEFFNKAMENANFHFYLLEDNGQYLGYAWVELREYKENAFLNSYKSVFVHQLSISKEHQDKGLGSQLMNKIYELAISHGIQKIELDYWVDNEVAKSFYKKNGFKGYREFIFKDL